MEEQDLPAKASGDPVQQGLQQTYLAKQNLTVPVLDQEHVFPIAECFIHLALIRQNEQENVSGEGNVEASLAMEEPFHTSKKPLALPQLFAPIGEGEKIPQRILITGRAGIGKSTLCHYIAYQWANPELQLFQQFKYVFWLSLKTITTLNCAGDFPLVDWMYRECFSEQARYKYVKNKNILQEILYEKPQQCLLLLDGFDEIASLYNTQTPQGNLLRKVMTEFPQVIVTSRPYQISLTNFDRQLENVGFTDASVDNYLKKFFSHAAKPDPEAEKTLRQFIRRQPLLKSIAYIPLNLFLLCELWRTRAGNELANQNPLTLVQLYQGFYKAFLARAATRANKNSDKITELEKLYSEALTSLEQTAFNNLCQSDGDLIIPEHKINRYGECEIKELLDTGFLRRIADRKEYYFVHLTFQEYFAARYLLHALNPAYKESTEFKDAIQFIRQNKYHPRYAIVMTFLAGLASQKEVDHKTVRYLWDALISVDVDWLGLRHIELVIRTLEQALGDERVPHRDKLLENIYQWLRASLRKPENDSSGFDKTLQEHLSHALLLSPQVASVCFKKLHAEWQTLKPEEKNIALKIYIAPLSQCVANVAVFFLELLKKPEELQNYLPILQKIDWSNLKDAAVASELTQYFLDLLKSNATENLKILAILALSELADITDEKIISEIIEMLEKDLSATEKIISLYAALTIEKLSGKDQALFKRLTGFLQSEDSLQKQETIKAASHIFKLKPATTELIEILLGFLDATEKNIRESAVQVLQEIAESGSGKYGELQQYLWRVLQEDQAGVAATPKNNIVWDPKIEKKRLDCLVKITGDLSSEKKWENRGVRLAAINSLGNLTKLSAEAITLLLKTLLDEDKIIGEAAAKALAKIAQNLTQARDVTPLLNALRHEKDGPLRRASPKALGNFYPQPTAEVVPAHLFHDVHDKIWHVRLDATKALAKLAEKAIPEVIIALVHAFHDEDWRVRKKAIKGLIEFAEKATTEVMMALLHGLRRDDDWYFRKALNDVVSGVDKYLYQSSKIKIIPALVNALNDEIWYRRLNAAKALGKFPEKIAPEVITALLNTSYDNDCRVGEAAIKAITKLGEKAAPESVAALLNALRNNGRIREAAAKGLAKLAKKSIPEVLVALQNALQDEDEHVRHVAARIMAKVTQNVTPPEQVATLLIKALCDKRSYISENDAKALRSILSEIPYAAFKNLLKSAEDENCSYREAATQALGNIKNVRSPTQEGSLSAFNLLLKNLMFADQQGRQKAFTKMQIFYREQSKEFIACLLQVLLDDANYLPVIMKIIFVFHVDHALLLEALKELSQKQGNESLLIHLKILYKPLVILMLREGIGIYPEGEELLLYTANGRTKFKLPENLHTSALQTILQLAQEFLQSWGIACQSYAEWQQAQRPFYAQRSSIRFFQDLNNIPHFAEFGLVPIVTHNQAIAAKKSENIAAYIKEIFVGNTVVEKEEVGYKSSINATKHAIQIRLDLSSEACQKNKLHVWHESLQKHVVNNSSCFYLDLGENALTNLELEILLENFLSKPESKNLRLLCLSFNQINSDGLKSLLKTLAKNPSIQYLLLDHNFIDFDAYFCEEYLIGENALLEKTGLVHLDISMNYIARGKHFEGNVLIREEELKKHVSEAKERKFNQLAIEQSLIVHSQCYFPVYSILDTTRNNPQCKIHAEKGIVGLFAYKTKVPGFNDHAFMMIEHIDERFGQRRLIMADLVQNKGIIQIRIHYVSPEKFQAKIRERPVDCKLAMITAEQVEKLLQEVFKSRDASAFGKYAVFPSKKGGKMNCLTWAAHLLQEIGVLKDAKAWTPAIPSPIMAVQQNKSCLTM